MAINVTRANTQAAEIAGKVNQLRNARNLLQKYKNELRSNWQGIEVGLFIESIDGEIRKIDALLGTLSNLSTDIRNAAEAIRREEEAAERAAAERAAQQRRAAQARQAYNAACDAVEEIIKERKKIIAKMRNTNSWLTMLKLNEDLKEIDERLSDAQDVCDRCRSALG